MALRLLESIIGIPCGAESGSDGRPVSRRFTMMKPHMMSPYNPHATQVYLGYPLNRHTNSTQAGPQTNLGTTSIMHTFCHTMHGMGSESMCVAMVVSVTRAPRWPVCWPAAASGARWCRSAPCACWHTPPGESHAGGPIPTPPTTISIWFVHRLC